HGCYFIPGQNFGFFRLPDELSTGSSIMPHKKNPDVFELIRARCNRLQALAYEITLMQNNLPAGYHRDMQIIKEHFFPAFEELNRCLEMAAFMLENIQINEHILKDEKYRYLFSVEEVNRLVSQGMPFREAYRLVGQQIAEGRFSTDIPRLHHTHEGSLGNLGNDRIQARMQEIIAGFQFEQVEKALTGLLEN
ncbi:MAG: argininosuccinate lyase, partial [Bacteroidia bacterium]|nr:argininosuccinate lyase [Bacteroidia bacterium]